MANQIKAKIKEIFASIQGEGPYVGVKQLFIRFCDCNLNCRYCDTEFSSKSDYVEYTPSELFEKVKAFNLDTIASVSLTGGEPLLSADFLAEFLPMMRGRKIYLETNATLYKEFDKIKPYVDIISADIKLESSTGIKNSYVLHDKFFEHAIGKECFAKIVFDETITDDEIDGCCLLARKYDLDLILQPMMKKNVMSVSPEFCTQILDKFLDRHIKVRLIPQMHKFINVI